MQLPSTFTPRLRLLLIGLANISNGLFTYPTRNTTTGLIFNWYDVLTVSWDTVFQDPEMWLSAFGPPARGQVESGGMKVIWKTFQVPPVGSTSFSFADSNNLNYQGQFPFTGHFELNKERGVLNGTKGVRGAQVTVTSTWGPVKTYALTATETGSMPTQSDRIPSEGHTLTPAPSQDLAVSGGAIAGIVTGGLAALASLVALVLVLMIRRRRRAVQPETGNIRSRPSPSESDHLTGSDVESNKSPRSRSLTFDENDVSSTSSGHQSSNTRYLCPVELDNTERTEMPGDDGAGEMGGGNIKRGYIASNRAGTSCQ